ncbi:MAG TPA: RHS repeat domain-containing protein, partial [Blastocatellia bacterium]|nr:RHS repeat domain-containing protein [Blastocatellia bacterium]
MNTQTFNWAWSGGPPQLPYQIASGDPFPITHASRDPKLASQLETVHDTGGSPITKLSEMDYDDDLNVIRTRYYDYSATSSPGNLLRTEETTYLVNDTSISQTTRNAYRARNLIRLPSKSLVKDAAGNVVAATEYKYDEYALTTYSTVTGWVDPQTTVRGNLTTVRRWQNFNYSTGAIQSWNGWTSGTWIETHTWYDQCGNVLKTRDANNNDTTYSYADNFQGVSSQNTYAYPTSVTLPVVGGASSGFTTTTKYDFYTGKVMSATDPNNVTSENEYETGNTLGRLLKVKSAVGTSVATQTRYIYNDSLSSSDPNARSVTVISDKTNYQESDSGTGIKSQSFYDGFGRTYRKAGYEGNNSWSITETQFDNLGRAYRTSNPFRASTANAALPSNPQWTTTKFDALGRVIEVETPDSTVAKPVRVKTAYSGNRVLVTDQAGRQRISESNGLGQLINVWEVTAADASTVSVTFPGYSSITAGYLTSYQYDTLGNLAKVTQEGKNASNATVTQERHFLYDSLGRLIRAKNPEQAANGNFNVSGLTGYNSWSLKYSYDNNGNLTHRTDARGTSTTYYYDALNRVTNTNYSDGTPNIIRYYDASTNGKGRPYITVTDYTGGNNAILRYSYDALGRTTSLEQYFQQATGWGSHPNGTWGTAFTTSRTYDRAGNVLSQTYPSGHTVNYTYNAAAQLDTFTGNLGDGTQRTYVAYSLYTPAGLLTQEKFQTFTHTFHNIQYNSRQQITDIRVGTGGDGLGATNTWNRGNLRFFYDSAPFGGPGGDNNGNIYRMDHLMPSNEAATQWSASLDYYNYDSLNRITGIWENKQSNSVGETFVYTQQYTYDRWGNRRINIGATTNLSGINRIDYKVNASTNQLKAPNDTGSGSDSIRYDAAGNQVFDNWSDPSATNTFERTYDAENRMKTTGQVGSVTNRYVYNADGKRVKR